MRLTRTLLPHPRLHPGAVLSLDLLTLRPTWPFLGSAPCCPGHRATGPTLRGGSGGREEPGTPSLSLRAPQSLRQLRPVPASSSHRTNVLGVQGPPEPLCHGSRFSRMTPTLRRRQPLTLLRLHSLRVAVSPKHCCVATLPLAGFPALLSSVSYTKSLHHKHLQQPLYFNR